MSSPNRQLGSQEYCRPTLSCGGPLGAHERLFTAAREPQERAQRRGRWRRGAARRGR
jgi:hypothetical protein